MVSWEAYNLPTIPPPPCILIYIHLLVAYIFSSDFFGIHYGERSNTYTQKSHLIHSSLSL